MPKFGVSIYSVCRKYRDNEWTPIEAIKWLAEQGAEVIEIVPFHIDFINEPEIIDQMKEAAKEAGVEIGNFSLNANFLQKNEEEYVEFSEETSDTEIDNYAKDSLLNYGFYEPDSRFIDFDDENWEEDEGGEAFLTHSCCKVFEDEDALEDFEEKDELEWEP